MYFNHSLMHMPVIPRAEFKGRSRRDWADSLLELDSDFAVLLDLLDELDVASDSLVIFAGDNGPEGVLLWRGTPVTGTVLFRRRGGQPAHSLHCALTRSHPSRAQQRRHHARHGLVHHPGGRHRRPNALDRIIDGVNQLDWLTGTTGESNREGYLYWMGPELYRPKWRNFKRMP